MIRSLQRIAGRNVYLIDGKEVSRAVFDESFAAQATSTPIKSLLDPTPAPVAPAPVAVVEPVVEPPKRRGRPPNSAKEPVDG